MTGRFEALRAGLWAAALGASLALAACAEGPKPNPTPVAAAPQPDAAQLKPGLAVRYWPYDVDDAAQVERLAASAGGNPGAPLPNVDYPENGNAVLTSSSKILVAAEISGFIKFPQSGRYAIAANSNDGVRVLVGGARVAEDTGAHPMTMTPAGEITVDGGVWYPLRVFYFQRRGTWGLQLLWAPAGEKLTIVPAAALARAGS